MHEEIERVGPRPQSPTFSDCSVTVKFRREPGPVIRTAISVEHAGEVDVAVCSLDALISATYALVDYISGLDSAFDNRRYDQRSREDKFSFDDFGPRMGGNGPRF